MRCATGWMVVWMVGCVSDPGTPLSEESTTQIADLWEGQTGKQTVSGVVISPRSATGTHFFIQDTSGGPRSGLRIQLDGFLEGLPPSVGVPILITGQVSWGEGLPHLKLNRFDDLEVIGDIDEPIRFPYPSPQAEDLHGALVEIPDITVTSRPDPSGRADSDRGLVLAGTFGFTPEWANTGTLIGVVTGTDEVSARDAQDWTGTRNVLASFDTDIESLRDGDWSNGTPVRFYATQTTPWSFDGRWVVTQDDQGRGIWIDGEAWGVSTDSWVGDTGWWEGEIRDHPVEGRYIRTWTDPEITITRGVLETQEWTDGALWSQSVSGMTLHQDGWMTDGGIVLDERLLPLEPLPDHTLVKGAVRQGLPTSLAVFEWE